jgi:tRNA threonylcarbamoyladenosine biosynthesis protein TsaB
VLGIALYEDGQLRAEIVRDVAGRHAERLLPELDAVLGALGWRPGELSGIGVSIGPGSFTGLRVGLATVKGIAFGGSPRVIGVPTLAALAEQGAREASRMADPVAALLDARRGEVYAAGWSDMRTQKTAILAESVYAPAELVEQLPRRAGLVIGEGASAVAEQVMAQRPDLVRFGSGELQARAAAVGRLAMPPLAAGRGVAADDLVPRYLRRAEAEVERTGEALE